jgi:hypothetical protein
VLLVQSLDLSLGAFVLGSQLGPLLVPVLGVELAVLEVTPDAGQARLGSGSVTDGLVAQGLKQASQDYAIRTAIARQSTSQTIRKSPKWRRGLPQ